MISSEEFQNVSEESDGGSKQIVAVGCSKCTEKWRAGVPPMWLVLSAVLLIQVTLEL